MIYVVHIVKEIKPIKLQLDGLCFIKKEKKRKWRVVLFICFKKSYFLSSECKSVCMC